MSDIVAIVRDGPAPEALLISTGPRGEKGDPGGNIMAIGLFTDASGLSIPAGTDAVRTSGHSITGLGIADYQWDGAVNAAYVTANPTTSFISTNGRGFRLSPSQQISVTMFGATGDGVANETSAFVAAIAFVKSLRTTGYGYGNSGPSLYVPAGIYNLSSTLTWDFGLNIFGEAGANGSGSVLNWTADVTGLYPTSPGTTIRNLYLDGAYAGTESDAYGIRVQASAFATIENVFIDHFAGDGVFVDGASGVTNLCRLTNVWVQNCRTGFFLDGADGNACTLLGCSAVVNRHYGFFDSSFLGCFFYGCHAAGNTLGGYRSDDLNAASLFSSCYDEGGQPTPVFGPKALVVGGLWANGATGGALFRAESDSLKIGPAAVVEGPLAADSLSFHLSAFVTATQATSKATTVTVNGAVGQITMASDALAAGASVKFTMLNSAIAGNTSMVIVHPGGSGYSDVYKVSVLIVASGAAEILVENIGVSSVSEPLQLNFIVFSAV